MMCTETDSCRVKLSVPHMPPSWACPDWHGVHAVALWSASLPTLKQLHSLGSRIMRNPGGACPTAVCQRSADFLLLFVFLMRGTTRASESFLLLMSSGGAHIPPQRFPHYFSLSFKSCLFWNAWIKKHWRGKGGSDLSESEFSWMGHQPLC